MVRLEDRFYLPLEAAAALDMSPEVFDYFDRKNMLCYILVDSIKVFTMSELDRFYREVILNEQS